MAVKGAEEEKASEEGGGDPLKNKYIYITNKITIINIIIYFLFF